MSQDASWLLLHSYHSAALILKEAPWSQSPVAVHSRNKCVPCSVVRSIDLLVVVIGLVVDNVEELQLVHSLRGRYDAEPITELHLLEELLGAVRREWWSVSCSSVRCSGCLSNLGRVALQVLEVATRQLVVGNDLDLAVTLLGDLDGLAKVADTTLDLDLLVQELLEGGDIEDLVRGRLGGVDDELLGDLAGLALLL